MGRSSHVVPVVLPAEAIWRGSHVSVFENNTRNSAVLDEQNISLIPCGLKTDSGCWPWHEGSGNRRAVAGVKESLLG